MAYLTALVVSLGVGIVLILAYPDIWGIVVAAYVLGWAIGAGSALLGVFNG